MVEERWGRPGRWAFVDKWERLALTDEQVDERIAQHRDAVVIEKLDNRSGNLYPAMETEALGQARIVQILTDRLDELMPEPLDDVLARQEEQRAEIEERLRDLLRSCTLVPDWRYAPHRGRRRQCDHLENRRPSRSWPSTCSARPTGRGSWSLAV